MIAIFTVGKVVIFRRTTAGIEHAWTVTGTERQLKEAYEAALAVKASAPRLLKPACSRKFESEEKRRAATA